MNYPFTNLPPDLPNPYPNIDIFIQDSSSRYYASFNSALKFPWCTIESSRFTWSNSDDKVKFLELKGGETRPRPPIPFPAGDVWQGNAK